MATTIVREFGRDELFKMRPQVGQVLTVKRNERSCVHLLCTRASNQNPIFTEDLDACLTRLAERFNFRERVKLHFPIIDPERGAITLRVLYGLLDRLYKDTVVQVVLHDRVYVTIGCYSVKNEDVVEVLARCKTKTD